MGNGGSTTSLRTYSSRLTKAMAVNPHYSESRDYKINCQSCSVAFEAQMRGQDVEAVAHSEMANKWYDAFEGEQVDVWDNETQIEEKQAEVARLQAKASAIEKKYGGSVMASISPDGRTYINYLNRVDTLNNQILNLHIHHYGRLTGFKGNTVTATSLKQVEDRVSSWGNGARGVVTVVWKNGGAHIFNVANENGRIVGYDSQNGRSGILSSYLSNAKRGGIFVTRVDNLKFNKDGLSGITRRK